MTRHFIIGDDWVEQYVERTIRNHYDVPLWSGYTDAQIEAERVKVRASLVAVLRAARKTLCM